MEQHDNNHNGQWIAALLTLLLCVGTVALLLTTFLNAPKLDAKDKQDYLVMDSVYYGGDLVILGDQIEEVDDELASEDVEEQTEEETKPDATEEAFDKKDNGREAKENKPLVTDRRESPMKVKEEPKKKPDETGKAKPKKNEKKEQNTRKPDNPGKPAPNSKINSRVGSSFAQNGSGKQGDRSGNSNTGGKNASAGFNGTDGYTVANFVYPDRPYLSEGTIRIKVVVNPRGKVTSATYAGGSGKAASDASLKKRCETAASRSSFSVKKSTTTNGIGTITYIIK